MKTRIFLLFLLGVWLSFASTIASQDGETPDSNGSLHRLLTQPRDATCMEYIDGACQVIPLYYSSGLIDSIEIVLDFVQQRCGAHRLADARILISIEKGEFKSNPCDHTLIDELMSSRHYYGRVLICGTFLDEKIADIVGDHWRNQSWGEFIEQWARDLVETVPSHTLAHLTAQHFAGSETEVMKRLDAQEFSGTCLQDEYNRQVRSVSEEYWKKRAIWAFGGGVWSPRGANSILGNKIELGVQAGYRFRRIGGDFILNMRFLKSESPYVVSYDNQMHTTEHFFGAFIGINPTFSLLRKGAFELEFTAGAGVDGFDSYSSEDDKENKSITVLGLNIGLTQRLLINDKVGWYLGLQEKLNFVNYDGGGTDLSGNTISINLLLGRIYNDSATSELYRLKGETR